jgi:hypothetical protein
VEPTIVSSTTIIYELTTGQVVAYERTVTAGQMLIASGIWALVVIALFCLVYLAAKGRL